MHLSRIMLLFPLILCLLAPCILQFSSNAEACGHHACRLWGAIGEPIPAEIVQDHLLNMPNSLKALGASNRNGWGLAYYNCTISNDTMVHRGRLPASEDSAFDDAAKETADSEPQVAMGHVRMATSGLINISDPHPFKRFKGGKWWLFAHNGGISKTVLIGLIGEEYLNENPPQVGNNTDQWIDSELYFIYVLKCVEEQGWNVTRGIAEATIAIHEKYNLATMNFLLTNGELLWGFCKGHSLYYCYATQNGNSTQTTAIASQYPSATQGNWTLLDDFDLIEASKNEPPKVSDVRLVSIPEYPTQTTVFALFLTLVAITLSLAVLLRKKRKRKLRRQSVLLESTT